jgi:hypothetical protein
MLCEQYQLLTRMASPKAIGKSLYPACGSGDQKHAERCYLGLTLARATCDRSRPRFGARPSPQDSRMVARSARTTRRPPYARSQTSTLALGFSRAGRQEEVERIGAALSALNSRVYYDLEPMLDACGLSGV